MSTFASQQHNSYKPQPSGGSLNPGLLLQRKCACGGSPGLAGECEACKKKRLQKKLSIGASNDPLEQEADRVADQVLSTPAHSAVSATPPRIQRYTGQATSEAGTAPASVDHVLSGSGRPLDTALQQDMGNRFGYDFSTVRVHTGSAAEQSARDVNAHAYTVGNNVVFGAGQFAPESHAGRKLIAHELTHVVQQSDKTNFLGKKIQRQEMEVELVETPYPEVLDLHNRGVDLPTVGTPPPVRGQTFHRDARQWNSQTTGRRPRRTTTKRAPGFTGDTSGTHLRHIDVQIHPTNTSIATLYWANMGNSPGFVLPANLHVSPGAGNCDKDCSDPTQSQQTGSHCTPLSPPDYTVQGFADNLPGDAAAAFVTWYKIDRGIAFHYYDVPAYPASHGCTRLERAESGAEWIYDNSLAGITTVRINRNPAEGQGAKCWRRGTLINRPTP